VRVRAGRLPATAVLAGFSLTLAACGNTSANTGSTLHLGASELVFSGVHGKHVITPQQVTVTNTGDAAQQISAVTITGDVADFAVAPHETTIPAHGKQDLTVRFTPGPARLGSVAAVMTLKLSGTAPRPVGLYGLATAGQQGRREPSLSAILTTLGYPVDVGTKKLILGKNARLGDEVTAPLFRAAGTGPVTLTPIARYSPDEALPYGWYVPAKSGTTPAEHRTGYIRTGQDQTLNPKYAGTTILNVGTGSFGIFVYSGLTHRLTFTEDRLNTGPIKHSVRTFPLHNRTGAPVPHGFILAFEDSSNADYQDYVFLLSGVTRLSS
jgi:hypothetical protein